MATGLYAGYKPMLGGPLDQRRRTYGGLYGVEPPGEPASMAYATQRPSYAGGTGRGLLNAPTDAAGYGQQMQAQNPGGRNFGGLLPTMVSSPSGGRRPGFLAPPPEQGPQWNPSQNQAWAAQNGLYVNRQGQMGPQSVMNMTPHQSALARIGLAPNQKYLTPEEAAAGRPAAIAAAQERQQGRREGVLNRVATRKENAREKQETALAAMQQRQFGLLAQMNPQMAVELAQLNQRGQIAQGQLAYQNAALHQQGLLGTQQSQDRRYVADQELLTTQHRAWGARYAEAVKAGHSPKDALRLAGPQPGAAPVTDQPPGDSSGGLLQAELAEIAKLPADQRETALRARGITSQQEIAAILQQLDPEHGKRKPGLLSRFGDTPMGWYFGGGVGEAIGNWIDPHGATAGLFGINPPPLVRPKQRGR